MAFEKRNDSNPTLTAENWLNIFLSTCGKADFSVLAFSEWTY